MSVRSKLRRAFSAVDDGKYSCLFNLRSPRGYESRADSAAI